MVKVKVIHHMLDDDLTKFMKARGITNKREGIKALRLYLSIVADAAFSDDFPVLTPIHSYNHEPSDPV